MARGKRGSGFNRLKYENCAIKKAIIFSNESDLDVDLTAAPDVQYAESIFSDTIEVDVTLSNTVGTVEGKTLMEGLPLVGTEDFILMIQDSNENDLTVELNVNKVTPIRKDTQQEQLSLRLTSEEFIRNEELSSRVVKRYDGKISGHIEQILTENLSTEKELFIDETSNNYNFIGNVRKPLYIINWLSKKSIPSSDGKKGKTAGFMFYQTSDGFHFKSIDSLLAQEPVKRYVYGNTSDSSSQTPEYDSEIVNLFPNNNLVANQKYRMGAYNTKLIAFNPYNCEYKIIEQDAFEDDDEGTSRSGKKLPVLNQKFGATPTRTTYILKDIGTLPTGKDPREQVKKHEEENFEVEQILNQAIRRYNQFCTTSIVIDIAPDFTLHAGDCIHVDLPDTGGGGIDKQISGRYIIGSLKHRIVEGKRGVTKLGLVRDSFGRKPMSGGMLT